MLKNTPLYIMKELQKRGIEVEVLDESASLLRFKTPEGQWRLLKSCVSDTSSAVGRFICDHKDVSNILARLVGMPLIPSIVYENDDQAAAFLDEHQPTVVKPVNGAHGAGVTVNISTIDDLKKAVEVAKEQDPWNEVLLQKMIHGDDARLLVIGGRFVAAVRRIPAQVKGDGVRSLKELIEHENETNPKRVTGYTGTMRKIDMESAQSFLKEDINRVPGKGECVQVIGTSNTSMGGVAVDETESIPKGIIKKVEALAAELRLPTCGVDFLIDGKGDYYFLEINGSPGFGPHIHPHKGESRNVTKLFVDDLLSRS